MPRANRYFLPADSFMQVVMCLIFDELTNGDA
jgi:hypothetical protein